MKTATIQVTVSVSYDETQLAYSDITAMLSERVTAFLYPAGLTVESATATVERKRRASSR